MERWLRVVVPRLVLGTVGRWARVVAMVVVLASGAYAPGVGLDNGWSAWLSADDPAGLAYARFRAAFGADEFLLVVGAPLDVHDPVALERACRFQDELVREAGAPAVDGPLVRDADGVRLDTSPWTAHLRGARRLGWIVRPSGDGRERDAVVQRVIALADESDQVFGVAGPEAINRALDRASVASLALLVPAAAGVTGLVLLAWLRSVRQVAAVLAVVSAAAVVTLAAMRLAGRSLNMVLVLLPVLLLVLGTAYALHVLSALSAGVARDPRRRWRAAIGATFVPSLFTALTSAAGFLSLAGSNLPPVRDLGLFAALGLVVAFALAFLALPVLVPKPSAAPARAARLALAPWLRRWRRPGFAAVGVAAVAAAIGSRGLSVETHVLRHLPANHPLLAATAVAEDELFGQTPIELWIEGPWEQVVAARSELAAVVRACADDGAITTAFSPLAALDALAWGRAAGHLDLALTAWPALRRFARRDGGELALRATLAVRTLDNARYVALVDRIEGVVAARTPAGVRIQVTGAVVLLARLQVALLRAQLATFGISFALVALLLVPLAGTLLRAAACLVPNVLPVLGLAGLMGGAGIPLDLATVTIAGFALGFVVDDTVHFLHAFRRARATGATAAAAVDHAVGGVGWPVLVAAASVGAGFLVLTLSPFRPIRHTGVLVATTAAISLVIELALLPSLLEWSDP